MHTHPKVAAVASQNWPFRHDAKCEPLLKFLKANIHEASSHAYPLNLPTRVREDPPFVDGGFGCPDAFGAMERRVAGNETLRYVQSCAQAVR